MSLKQKSQPWPKHNWCNTKCISFGPLKNGVPKGDAHFQNSRRVLYENAEEIRNIDLISPEVRAQNSLWKKSDRLEPKETHAAIQRGRMVPWGDVRLLRACAGASLLVTPLNGQKVHVFCCYFHILSISFHKINFRYLITLRYWSQDVNFSVQIANYTLVYKFILQNCRSIINFTYNSENILTYFVFCNF